MSPTLLVFLHLLQVHLSSAPSPPQNRNSLLVQRQTDNIAPGILGREGFFFLAHKRRNLIQTTREVISVPDSRRKEVMFIGVIGVCTCEGCLKCQRVLASATSNFWDKVIYRNSGFTFQTFIKRNEPACDRGFTIGTIG